MLGRHDPAKLLKAELAGSPDSVAQALAILEQVVDAMKKAHNAGVIHRGRF